MNAHRTYVVTPREGEPYRVTISPASNGRAGWIGEVERGGERWTFDLAPGPHEGFLWAGTRPVRWRWNASAGQLVMNGESHVLTVETEAAHRLASGDGRARTAARVEEIRAPMPGLVLAVEVEEGQSVEAGKGVLIIEAMKMENEIVAPVSGVVRSIAVMAGEAIERGALLCRIEPPESTA